MWMRRDGGNSIGGRSLWTVVTPQASVYAIRRSRGAKVLQELLGKDYAGTIGSDRAKAYDCYPLRQRQLCWSHLRRDAQAMIDRGGPGRKVGEQLLEHADVLFAWRRWLREGKWSRQHVATADGRLTPVVSPRVAVGHAGAV